MDCRPVRYTQQASLALSVKPRRDFLPTAAPTVQHQELLQPTTTVATTLKEQTEFNSFLYDRGKFILK